MAGVCVGRYRAHGADGGGSEAATVVRTGDKIGGGRNGEMWRGRVAKVSDSEPAMEIGGSERWGEGMNQAERVEKDVFFKFTLEHSESHLREKICAKHWIKKSK